ncbi:MAG: exodeoxyribonuclease III [Rickettsiales bacterium]|jgi:exodeoxyribonuclease-3
MPLKIISWNINSVRIRIPLLQKIVEQVQPDIICLQETKANDDVFPLADLQALGFPHIAFSGQKSYNGVAILSKHEFSKIECLSIAGSDDKRHISVELTGGVSLHNFYIPAGGDIPDPLLNPAYDFKLRFVEQMTDWSHRLKKSQKNAIILGDFNIAPLPNDVWSHKQLMNVVSHTEPEITRLNALKESYDWCDVARHFVDSEQKLYSWWSYRNKDWRKSNRGRRLDHIWVTPALTTALKNFSILQDARDFPSPSDHVPLLLEIDL